ncbi:MAG: amidohydrolase family protein [Bacteroidota bacterium]
MMAHDFREALQLGEILKDEFIVDAHAHMDTWYNFHIPEQGTPASMVHSMDLLGIDITIVAPHICIGPDYCKGNRDAYAAARQFPGRLLPFVTVNPNYPIEDIQAEIEYWDKQGPIVGFKFHPSCHAADACHENYYPVFEYCQERSLPILSHNWTGGSVNGKETLHGLAEVFPRVTFIIGHAASGWSVIDTNCEIANRYQNVMLDTTGSGLFFDAIPEMVRRVGPERIIWGTDNPFIDPRPALGRLLLARIGDDEKRMILGLNAKRIFRL